MRPLRLTFSCLLAALCTSLAFGPARADDETATRSTVVGLADLDLASVSGRTLAQARITRAAREVCEAADIRHLHVAADALRCQAEALGHAAPQLQLLTETARQQRHSVTVIDTVGH